MDSGNQHIVYKVGKLFSSVKVIIIGSHPLTSIIDTIINLINNTHYLYEKTQHLYKRLYIYL